MRQACSPWRSQRSPAGSAGGWKSEGSARQAALRSVAVEEGHQPDSPQPFPVSETFPENNNVMVQVTPSRPGSYSARQTDRVLAQRRLTGHPPPRSAR